MTAVPTRKAGMGRGVRGLLVVAAAVLVAAFAAGPPRRSGPPLDPRSDDPLGTSALVSLLKRFDTDVELSSGLPGRDDDIALVLQDRLSLDQTAEVEAWVRAGGTLVITDPGSSLVPLPMGGGGLLPEQGTLARGTCTIDALADVAEVDGGTPVRYDVPETADLCFGTRDDGAFVVAGRLGAGEVVGIGGAAFLTNERLDELDNAVLAVALLGPEPGRQVRFVNAPLPAGGGDKTLGDLVPDGVRRALVQLGIAFLFYAAWRAIRLGRPVSEHQPVAIAGSELVAATGRLLARSRNPAATAEIVRDDLRRRARVRFGVPASSELPTLVAVVARRTGHPEAQVAAALDDRPIRTDEDLVALARAISTLDQEVPR